MLFYLVMLMATLAVGAGVFADDIASNNANVNEPFTFQGKFTSPSGS